MKRLLAFVAALFMLIPLVSAQSGFGIKGGMNFNTMSDMKPTDGGLINVKARTGYHFGVMYKAKLPLGFALQPELLYINKNSRMEFGEQNSKDYLSQDAKLHYLQLPVGVQWGIDLVLFRPYLQFTPYIGYAISKGGIYNKVSWDDLNRFEYGFGLGAGIEVWKIQLSGRYSWDLGKVSNFEWPKLRKEVKREKNRGFELSIGFLF